MTTLSNSALEIAEAISLVLSSSIGNQNDSYHQAIEDVQKFASKHRARHSTGAYRTAMVFKDFVVKFSLDERRQDALISEADYINNMRQDPKYGRHFPETYLVQVGSVPVLLQERVRNIGGFNIPYTLQSYAEELADHLGIYDMHEENYGWAGKGGKKYPVFIDVDLRNGRHPDDSTSEYSKPSWAVHRHGARRNWWR